MYILYSLVIASLIFVIYKLINSFKFLYAVDKIPGPKGIAFIGNLLDLIGPPERLFTKLHENSKQFYPIYRLRSGFNAGVLIMSPEDIEMVISGMKHLEKSQVYDCLHHWLELGLLTSTDERWRNRRKILTPAFHFNILQQFTLTFIEQSSKLIETLSKEANKPVDVVPIMAKYTLNSICETAMGSSLENEAVSYREAIYKMGELTIFRVLRPWYYYKLIYIFSPKFYESISISKFLHSYSKKVINERKRNFKPVDIPKSEIDVYTSKRRLAMLDLLLTAKAEGESIDDEGIREEVDTFMFEGHDTTAMSISFTLMLLACDSKIQDKVLEELGNIFGDSNRSVTYEDLQNMKYLERVLKESLRLYPSVPMIGRCLSESITTHSGYVIPRDTNVLIRIYDLHHDPKIYPDPEKFDPDRFLPENIKCRHPYAYIPFSAGPRNCIGQRFAILELKAAVAIILRKFELLPVDTPQTISLATDLIIRSNAGVQVLFRPRQTL